MLAALKRAKRRAEDLAIGPQARKDDRAGPREWPAGVFARPVPPVSRTTAARVYAFSRTVLTKRARWSHRSELYIFKNCAGEVGVSNLHPLQYRPG